MRLARPLRMIYGLECQISLCNLAIQPDKRVGVPITIQEVVDLSHLGCELVAGHRGASRQATWAHVCELEDPVPWLEGGELLMTTGMAIPRDASRQRDYLSRLYSAGAAALAISKDLRAPDLSPELMQEADRLAFPILLVSIEVPFLAIARIVIMANQDAAHRELVLQLSVFDVLRSGNDGDIASLFRRLEDVSGYSLYLSSPTGSSLLPGVPTFPDTRKDLLGRPSDAPAYVPGGYVVSVPIAGRIAGSLLGLWRSGAQPGGLATLQHIATIAALQRATLERERETERREGGELLAELLKGQPGGEVAARIRQSLRDAAIALYLIRTADIEADSAVIHHHLADIGCEHLMVSQQEIILLVPANAPMSDLLNALQGAHAGRSRQFWFGGSFALAERQARAALSRAVERGETVVDASSFVSELDWLPSDPVLRRAFTERVLGGLLAQQRTSAERLLDTLRVWLQYGQRSGEAARRLGIHPHTLSYRLRRVEALTGLDLTSPAAVVELWLALELQREAVWPRLVS
jgi:PucR family transcriptional regulator, purine catabolism regulatory protein